jgi:hypothetical protein
MGQSLDRLAKSRAVETTKTSQRRLCRMFPACGPNKTPQS